MQVFGRPHKVTLPGEVSGIDNQGLALPAAPRVPVPLADSRRQMGTPVQGNDASLVDDLHHHDYVAGTLQNLVVTIGTRAEVAAQPWHAEGNTAKRVADVFRSRWSAQPGLGHSLSLPRRRR